MAGEEKKECFLKRIEWRKTVKPVIGYAIFGGAVALAVIIGLVCCL